MKKQKGIQNKEHNYTRHVIDLGGSFLALVNIFKQEERPLEEIFVMSDVTAENPDPDFYDRQAKQFIDQLHGCYCQAFLESLAKEIMKETISWDNQNNKLSALCKKDDISNGAERLIDEFKGLIKKLKTK